MILDDLSTGRPEYAAGRPLYVADDVGEGIALVRHLLRNGCRRTVFSSSAAVYAGTAHAGVHESSPVAPGSPYTRGKLMLEDVLRDVAPGAAPRVLCLRYFNPVGADPLLRPVPTVTSPRRPGDDVGCFSLPDKAFHPRWAPTKTLTEAVADAPAWRERGDEVLGSFGTHDGRVGTPRVAQEVG